MPDNHGVVVSRCNATAEALAVFHLKVFFGSDQDIRRRIELQELRRPLLRQVIRHDKEGFIAKSEPLGFHCGGSHFKGLACTHSVC